jgi:streptogramin lyase
VLLAQTTTDGTGGYSLDSTSIHVSQDGLIYVVAEAPGTSLRLLSLMGVYCPGTPNCPFQNVVTLNELSSVAALYSVAAYVSNADQLSVAGPLAGIELSNGNFLSLMDPVAGALVSELHSLSCSIDSGMDPNCMVKQKLYTLSNALTNCGQSSTEAVNACQQWMQLGSKANHALSVLFQLISVPTLRNNGSAAFGVPRTYTTFSPELAFAPSDWSLALNFSGAGLAAPGNLAIDASGRVWVSNGMAPSSISAFNNNGTAFSPSVGFNGNGLSGPQGLAVDSMGRIWVANWAQGSGSTLSIFNADGTATSGSPIASEKINNVSSISGPIGLALSSNGSMWVANFGNSTLAQYSSTTLGLVIGPMSGAGLSFPVNVATDNLGNVWLVNSSDSSISEWDAAGHPVALGAYKSAQLDIPVGLAVSSQGTLWVSNLAGNSLTEMNGGNAPIASCESAASASVTGCTVTTVQPSGSALRQPNGVAMDGAGHLWVVNRSSSSLVELDGNGSLLSNASGYSTSAMQNSTQLAIDAAGSIWVTNYGNNTLTKFIGLAAPVATPMQGAPKPL